jgi:hypothetical protein
MELVDGNTGIMVIKELNEVDENKINYHVMGHIIKKKRKTEFTDYSKISKKIPARYLDGNLLICWNGNSIAILGDGANGLERFTEKKGLEELNLDYLVISNICQNIEGLVSIVKGGENIIIDSSDSHILNKTGVENQNESIYNIPVQGPYVKQINKGKW